MKFQSTLPRGERHVVSFVKASFSYFNPRSREGSDIFNQRWLNIVIISIHAPARGATHQIFSSQFFIQFQSTLPRGERLVCGCTDSFSSNFNPRSREGSDSITFDFAPYIQISIHAPARGATQFGKLLRTNRDISIHAPARGAT